MVEISPKELAEEAKYITRIKLLWATWGKTKDAGICMVIILFPQPIKAPFRLFGDLAPSCPLWKRTNIR